MLFEFDVTVDSSMQTYRITTVMSKKALLLQRILLFGINAVMRFG